ncbi:MAG: glutamine--fructose-6-phosphate transaminase (isomerizing) [Bacteroidetes bacterium]|nr:MAG: glutamine--fructose-6-phosphate transaminase (isomerizing) [Bacteroidota bacterium]
MCGIFGVINGQSVTSSLMDGLDALSYRGYDSAGIVVIGSNGLERRRAEGKLECLERVLEKAPLEGTIGIAHTRWATHGSPTKRNAHPHMTSRVAVVHNGIIENYLNLRKNLENDSYIFQSDTDSETIPLLITSFLEKGLDHVNALLETRNLLDGSFAIAAVFNDQPDLLFAMRQGSPLVLSQANGGYTIASDVNALGTDASTVCHLEDGDLACIGRDKVVIIDINGHSVKRAVHIIDSSNHQCDKQGYRHYMLKEIHEQPKVLQQTVEHYLNTSRSKVKLPFFPFRLDASQRLSIIACGTSHYAGMIGKYWLEGFSGLPINIDIASEYRYRNAPLIQDEAALFISQSGETADTLAALRYAKSAGQNTLSIVNVSNSSMAHESDGLLPTLAGVEIGVASTKAFTAQLAVLLMLALAMARKNRLIDSMEEKRLLGELLKLPEAMSSFIQNEQTIRRVAKKLQNAKHMIYLGRGIAFPLALEGALKLKEISYIQAEAYPAGELKHGPIALVDEQMPVVMIAPPGPLFSKSLSNLREVTSRGAKVILISDQVGVNEAGEFIADAIVMPEIEELLQPILYTLPLQLLAYYVAVLKGTDIDQPRNLAKSVTVE